MSTRAPYPLYAVLTLAVHAQGLGQSLGRKSQPGIEEIYAAVERVGGVQIDTLQVVNRAHYLTLWSRLGSYDTSLLDKLLFDEGSTTPNNERRLFEYWAHAACIIPLTLYRYFLPRMRSYREGDNSWYRNWLAKPESQQKTAAILAAVHERGGSRPADFRTEKRAPGAWWNWDEAKVALEHLYNVGELAIANRINFQRIYDVRDRVLPEWVDRAEPSAAEAHRQLLELAMRAFGVCAPGQVGSYFKFTPTEARPYVRELIDNGTFVRIQGELADGKAHELLVHREHLPLLDAAADGALRVRRTTFLNHFDSLFRARGRDRAMWGFHQKLECYTREPERVWGYFCLPILNKRNLVGRFDPKLERKTGLLRIKALYLEPGVKPSDRLAASVARAMRDFMRFHAATDLAIERSDPPEFGAKLMSAL